MQLHYQNYKWARVSENSPQKEHESACFRPILKSKSFVAIRLWRNMNWNTRNFVSAVHRKGRRYAFSQFTFAFPIIFSLDSHFPCMAFKRGDCLFFDNGFVNGFTGFF